MGPWAQGPWAQGPRAAHTAFGGSGGGGPGAPCKGPCKGFWVYRKLLGSYVGPEGPMRACSTVVLRLAAMAVYGLVHAHMALSQNSTTGVHVR